MKEMMLRSLGLCFLALGLVLGGLDSLSAQMAPMGNMDALFKGLDKDPEFLKLLGSEHKDSRGSLVLQGRPKSDYKPRVQALERLNQNPRAGAKRAFEFAREDCRLLPQYSNKIKKDIHVPECEKYFQQLAKNTDEIDDTTAWMLHHTYLLVMRGQMEDWSEDKLKQEQQNLMFREDSPILGSMNIPPEAREMMRQMQKNSN
ncbi:MAG: hypothetical protein EA369_03320 [Bradymonadales bacterium]|nr:MAG: hypothetical protein EA369_03320 [Bradymonadales bacterium]